jgi:hypothetical protein
MPVQGEIMSETLAEQEPSLICRHATAANRLSVGRISLRQPAAEAETDKGPHRALAAWTWSHYAQPALYLRLLESSCERVHRPRRQRDGGRSVCPPRLRNGHRRSRVRRCRRKQVGTASASFDVGVMNGIERPHLFVDVTNLRQISTYERPTRRRRYATSTSSTSSRSRYDDGMPEVQNRTPGGE